MDWGNCVLNGSTPASSASGAASLNCLPVLFQNARDSLLIFAGIIAVIFVIIAGMRFLFSGGDPKQVEEARKTMTYALLGLIVVVLAFLIINLIAIITGVTCINNFGFQSCNQLPNSGSPTGVVGTGIIGLKGAGICADNNICFEHGTDPNSAEVALGQFSSFFSADCKSPSCKKPSHLIPYIYDQRQVSIPEFQCDKGPQSVACGPTSLSMIAESFNGEDKNPDNTKRDQTANNLTRFFLENKPPLMNCGGSVDPNIVDYSHLTDQTDKTLQVRMQARHEGSSFSDLESYYQSTGNPVMTGVWWGGFKNVQDHYTVVAGISDNFVWLADPLLSWPGNAELGSQVVLKIPRQQFIDSYFDGTYWEIQPVPQ